jgi:hypothetical protein
MKVSFKSENSLPVAETGKRYGRERGEDDIATLTLRFYPSRTAFSLCSDLFRNRTEGFQDLEYNTDTTEVQGR